MEGAAAGDQQLPSSLVFRGCNLPPGFRFQPTDQEIIVCYLKKKIAGTATSITSIIADVDIYKFDPWDLPDKATFGEGEWFFFSPRDRKYPNGARPNRTAGSGYWKATGTDKPILAAGGAHCLGVKKALVFYQGRSPKGSKTEWVMHEYRLLDTDAAAVLARPTAHSMRLDDWVLCRVRKKGVSLGPADMDDTACDGTTTTAAAVPANAATTDDHHHAEIEMATAAAAAHSREALRHHQVPDAGITGGGFGDFFLDWNNDEDDGGHLLKYSQYLISGGSLGGSPSPSPHHIHALQDDHRPSSAAIGHHDQGHGGHGGTVPLPVPGAASGGATHTHQHQGLFSMLETIKRNLSFQAIDEFYLLQPSTKRPKTPSCMLFSRGGDDADDLGYQHSMSSSFSISDTDNVF